MTKVLMFNIAAVKAAKIKMLCRQFFMETTEVPKEDFGCKMSYLLGLSDDGSRAERADFDGEMLYFSDVNGAFFSIFLDQLKRKKVPVDLKAVKTETNVNFTAYELFRELSAEREAIAKGKSAH